MTQETEDDLIRRLLRERAELQSRLERAEAVVRAAEVYQEKKEAFDNMMGEWARTDKMPLDPYKTGQYVELAQITLFDAVDAWRNKP